MMASDLSRDLRIVNERLGHGAEWTERPVVSRSPTPLALRDVMTAEDTSYRTVVEAYENDIRMYPGSSYPVKMASEGRYRMIPKNALGVNGLAVTARGPFDSEEPSIFANSRGSTLRKTTHPILPQRGSDVRPALNNQKSDGSANEKADENIGAELIRYSELVGASQPPVSLVPPQKLTKDSSRKTRGSRITKVRAQRQGIANNGTQFKQGAPTPAEAPASDRRPKRLRQAFDVADHSDGTHPQVPRKPHKRQPKVYKQERESRRLAGLLPEFGLLPKRGEPALSYESSLQHPSNTCNPSPVKNRSRASSKKKSIAVKSAKPQGISKSGHKDMNRPKRSKKQSVV